MLTKIISFFGLIQVLLLSNVLAATIFMKDGTREYGFLIEERADTVVIRRGGRDIEISRDKVDSIETAPPVEQVQLYEQVMSFYSNNPNPYSSPKPIADSSESSNKAKTSENYYSPDKNSSMVGIDGGVFHGLEDIEESARRAEDELARMRREVDDDLYDYDKVEQMEDENQQLESSFEYQNNMLNMLEQVGYDVDELRDAIAPNDPF